MKARHDCDCPCHKGDWIYMVACVLVRPAWVRLLLLAACAPLFASAANWTYLSALPSRFQTERATAPDLGDWKTMCTVPDMEVAVVRSPPDTSLAGAGQAWLRAKDGYVVLTMPSCHTRLITKPDDTVQLDLDFVSPAGFVPSSLRRISAPILHANGAFLDSSQARGRRSSQSPLATF
jgi:hypothetical protein